MGFIKYVHSAVIDRDVLHSTQTLRGPICLLKYGDYPVHLKLDMDVSKIRMAEQRVRAIVLFQLLKTGTRKTLDYMSVQMVPCLTRGRRVL